MIAYVQSNYSVPQSSTSTVSSVFQSAQTAGNTNVVAIGWGDATSTITSVTDTSGNAYILAIGPTRLSGSISQSIYISSNIKAASANSNTVTVNFSASVPYPDLKILEYSGLALSNSLDGALGDTGSGTLATVGPLTTTNAIDLILASTYTTTSTTGPGAGYTQRILTSPDASIVEDMTTSTAAPYSATANMTSGSYVMQMIAIKGASSMSTTVGIYVRKVSSGLAMRVNDTTSTTKQGIMCRDGTSASIGINVLVVTDGSGIDVWFP